MPAILFFTALLSFTVPQARPAPATTEAFDRYVTTIEARIRQSDNSAYLFAPPSASLTPEARLGTSGIFIGPIGPGAIQVPGGLIHDWAGAVLIHDATVAQVLRIVQDYDRLTRYYAPSVMASRLISRHGDDFHIAIRMREHNVITVVMDAEYDVHYWRLDPARQFSFSRSTHITEIADAGQPSEHPVGASDNHGYLWRLNSYWRFTQKQNDVAVECEAVSLTRDIPTGLGWLIGPYLKEIPRESLRSTLIATRDAVEAANGRSGQSNRNTLAQ